jgi:hypothetical protein
MEIYRACTAANVRGDSARNRSTVAGIIAIARSTSSDVVARPRLNRKLDRASSADKPMASNTCDGSTAPDEHAAPVEHETP